MLARLHTRIRAQQQQEGFTLIELLVVIIILGILLAIAIPSYLSYQQRARDTVAKTDAGTMARAVEQCHAINGRYITICIDRPGIEAAAGGPLDVTYGWGPGEVEVDPCTEANPPNPTCGPGADGYFVIAKSRTGHTFWVYNWTGLAGGQKRTCSPAGSGGCGSDGTW